MAEADPAIQIPARQAAIATPAFAIRLNAFLRVRPFVSTEELRYYLNGVRIEANPDGGAVCVATDGHRMGVCRDADGLVLSPVTVRIFREIAAWKPEYKLFGSPWLVGMMTSETNGFIAIVHPQQDENGEDTAAHAIARVEDCALRVGRAFVDGRYPEWRKVIPTNATSGQARTLNADYVKSFATKKNTTATIVGANPEAPQLVCIDGDPDFFGVLMPVRAARGPAIPSWLTPAA